MFELSLYTHLIQQFLNNPYADVFSSLLLDDNSNSARSLLPFQSTTPESTKSECRRLLPGLESGMKQPYMRPSEMTRGGHTELPLEPDPYPLFTDVHSHTLPTVELSVCRKQGKTYGVILKC